MIDPDRLNIANLAFIEDLYAEYLRDPSSVPLRWQQEFEGFSSRDRLGMRGRGAPPVRPESIFHGNGTGSLGAARRKVDERSVLLQDRVDQLIRAYRTRGHMIAELDPLGMSRPRPPELDPAYYGLTEEDEDREFSCDTIPGDSVRSLRDIREHLRRTYCRSIGVQYMHIDDLASRWWLRDRMEKTENRIELDREEQVRILTRLTDAVIFEDFVQKKYTGAKTFSLEGAESLIPLLDLAIEKAANQGIDEIVLAMAHRGRLNVLANILGKTPQEIFSEFEDVSPELYLGSGDVKYHLGYSADWKARCGRTVHLSLCFNPSHLEFVNPVALGRMRAKQDRAGDREGPRGMALLIHGDASFAGEGIVQETLNMSQLEAYSTGGTIHVVVNNQIGFTTTPQEGRSGVYATAVARILQVPIFHVNGEDPEAVAQVISLAMDFRERYRRDVVIDMYCYRRRGHNEGDEPSFTQPLMYRAIAERMSVRDSYLESLLKLGGIEAEEADRIAEERRRRLEEALEDVREREEEHKHKSRISSLEKLWSGYSGGVESNAEEVDTGIEKMRLVRLLESQAEMPVDFHLHPKLERLLERRLKVVREEAPVDWGTAEALAFATLATEGHRVRMTGQDTARGTFSHRHAVLYDHEDGHRYVPLAHVSPDQAPVEIWNSPLSEAGVLGFEYGYSLDYPEALVLWEAQFGDFVNAGQVIIDQFISSAEDKWRRLSGLVLLLPHGFEGMGPEHSSARLERFLVLAAEDNIQVVYPTTPAQFFHCLRRQVLRRWRKPLIVMSPKSLLRHSRAMSDLDELTRGRFRRVIEDPSGNERPERVLLASGKVYYDLEEERESRERDDVAIVRVEQLSPFPDQALEECLARYPEGTPVSWVQEEPENMGAWRQLRARFLGSLYDRHPFSGVFRPASASPATGSAASHRLEQRKLLAEAFGDEDEVRELEERVRAVMKGSTPENGS